jgi:hypothetical protein
MCGLHLIHILFKARLEKKWARRFVDAVKIALILPQKCHSFMQKDCRGWAVESTCPTARLYLRTSTFPPGWLLDIIDKQLLIREDSQQNEGIKSYISLGEL